MALLWPARVCLQSSASPYSTWGRGARPHGNGGAPPAGGYGTRLGPGRRLGPCGPGPASPARLLELASSMGCCSPMGTGTMPGLGAARAAFPGRTCFVPGGALLSGASLALMGWTLPCFILSLVPGQGRAMPSPACWRSTLGAPGAPSRRRASLRRTPPRWRVASAGRCWPPITAPSSSARVLVKRTAPRFVIFSAALPSPFGHPHDAVVARWRAEARTPC